MSSELSYDEQRERYREALAVKRKHFGISTVGAVLCGLGAIGGTLAGIPWLALVSSIGVLLCGGWAFFFGMQPEAPVRSNPVFNPRPERDTVFEKIGDPSHCRMELHVPDKFDVRFALPTHLWQVLLETEEDKARGRLAIDWDAGIGLIISTPKQARAGAEVVDVWDCGAEVCFKPYYQSLFPYWYRFGAGNYAASVATYRDHRNVAHQVILVYMDQLQRANGSETDFAAA